MKKNKPEKFCEIIIYIADLLYTEGEKILEQKQNYARYYARKYFAKADKIKSYIDEKMKKDMSYDIQKLYNTLEKNYPNKVGQNDAFVQALEGQIKAKSTCYITGFTFVRNKIFKNLYLKIKII